MDTVVVYDTDMRFCVHVMMSPLAQKKCRLPYSVTTLPAVQQQRNATINSKMKAVLTLLSRLNSLEINQEF